MRFLSDHTLVDYVLIRKLIEHNWLDILRMHQGGDSDMKNPAA